MKNNDKRGWTEVTKSSPCPICAKSNWCSRSDDGEIVACRREAEGAAQAKTDKNGAPYYVHHLNREAKGRSYVYPGHLRQPPPSPAQEVEATDPDTLHRVYTVMIDNLPLTVEHRDALRRRGFPDAEIDGRGYRSFSSEGRAELASRLIDLLGEQVCRRVPGFLPSSEERGPTLAGPEGLLVPCRDLQGRIVALKVRRDAVEDGKGKYTYLSSTKHGGAGPGAPVHVPLRIDTPAAVVRLTEGELKADLATVRSGVPTIGTGSGAGGWRACLPVLRQLGAKTVRVAFDVDAQQNQHVGRAQVDCIETLHGEGFVVELERWSQSVGKGIDDALAAGAETEILSGNAALAAAREIAASAGVQLAGPATATVSVDGVGDVTLTVEAAGTKPQRKVSAKVGEVRHDDRIDVALAMSRRRFVAALADKIKVPLDTLYAALDSRLVDLGAAADLRAKSDMRGDVADEARQSQATAITELAAAWELWHTPAGDAYATIAVGEHVEHWPVRSQTFRRWVAKAHYDATGNAANAEAIRAALSLVEAQAVHDGQEHQVFVRVADRDGNVYIDLCDADWRAVEITPRGWRIVENPPVRFRRTKGMLALPEPQRGGAVDDLRPFINVDDVDWILVVAWLMASLCPRGPYPLLALFATQGAGKSNAAKVLRALVDPNAAPIRAEPREPRDLMISAAGNWCIAYDNLSHLPAWLSDALCRLSTGGGFATRELFSDGDEVIFDAMRPAILTSIVELAERSDLLDRCLLVNLPPIGDERRRDEKTLWAEFEAARPKILGALFDAVAGALRDLPQVSLERLPRMADFAKWVTAGESALGWAPGTFMAAHTHNRNAANELALEASPIADRLLSILGDKQQWEGTAKDVLAALDATFGSDSRRPQGWPKNPRSLSEHLRRLAPNLGAAGWSVAFSRLPGGARTRLITIVRFHS
ncbi:MAG TPA: DUF3854 domain-containing protein [Pirellulales bacterium]|nr:DUF3854 domain-containing protein [Pirellulales bacterium]